jgi:hypothetical protein
MTDELYRIVSGLAAARPRRGYSGPRDLPVSERDLIDAARETGALEDLFGAEYGERIAQVFAEYTGGFDLPADRQRKVGAIIEELLASETRTRLFPDVTAVSIDDDIAEEVHADELAALEAMGRPVIRTNRGSCIRKPLALLSDSDDNKGGPKQ